MRRVISWIHVHSEPAQLRTSVEAVKASSGCNWSIWLLPEGLDEPTRVAAHYPGNPWGFASVHFCGLPKKPSDDARRVLARAIVGRRR